MAETTSSDSGRKLPFSMIRKLDDILHGRVHHLVRHHADTASGWLDLAQEAAYAQRVEQCLEALTQLEHAPGSDRPEVRLAAYRTRASVLHSLGETQRAEQDVTARAEVLRSVGQYHQADLEEQLGTMLFAEPDSFSATVLQGVVDTEREALQRHRYDTVLSDALIALATIRVCEHATEEALELITEALDVIRWRRDEGLVVSRSATDTAHMFAAHVYLMTEQFSAAAATAGELLSTGCHRAIRAAMWMVQAAVAHHREDSALAAEYAVQALETYVRIGARSGAASAAGLCAAMASQLGETSVAVTAWKIAAAEAEQGEIPESGGLLFALGHQLLEAEEYKDAEEVLTGLVRRAEISGDRASQAQVLVDLGQALRRQHRTQEAIEHWHQAIELMLSTGARQEAVHVYLALGALHSTEDEPRRARTAVQHAVTVARQLPTPNMVLAQALNALGHLMCDQGDHEGILHLNEAIEIAQHTGATWYQADYMDTQARGYWSLHNGVNAVATALNAADLFTTADDPDGAARAELFAGHVLLEQDREVEAATLLSQLLETETLDTGARIAALMGLAEAQERTGDNMAAQQSRRRVEELEAQALNRRDESTC
ncbi:tetratricopeptide repeat protein [Auritidibacter ignavus]|uniref:tetratricopeptide repeat protein n=1 Tax=Auritidibacter TaxID=1160973 RepID=UPI000D7393DC|nr:MULTISPECIES: tetratricopeptide repeat protein [Auritidibacter]AXR73073.1 hypothetical protein DCC27_000740 [Auritidibacter sp. NML130574]PXA81827.1 hypothetical protein DCC25_00070 [Auritidibacter sp. NML120636]WGH81612.1 tetratricopeptide repeat protein [Auritidibacter ignavus]WGH86222.1 tetratricopeptide repeat protein [Auritidibacter ignavus]WGH88506.1 tetratricopeptide repeat protein [Auritidibacter ignavus]